MFVTALHSGRISSEQSKSAKLKTGTTMETKGTVALVARMIFGSQHRGVRRRGAAHRRSQARDISGSYNLGGVPQRITFGSLQGTLKGRDSFYKEPLKVEIPFKEPFKGRDSF